MIARSTASSTPSTATSAKSWLAAIDRGGATRLLKKRARLTRGGVFGAMANALSAPPPSLALDAPLQQAAWRCVIARGGRPIRTMELATSLGVTREHLSRSFSAAGAPNLKRVIDLVRLLAAAELSKNPGYDVRDVARVLGFASASHLSSTAQRVVGTKPASLSRLRAIDLFERFGQGRGRSRRTT